ncbi:MAG: hypothetical protein H6576_06545 [Lewinellaceae bacterium]|nr:hypothetical protein [Saprospiraceae bacterium]MCB9343336.1 hypothetical protein [Lewinellaceae bacterium]
MSQSRFTPWITIRCKHEFFANTEVKGFSLAPDQETKALLRQAGVKVKTAADGLTLFRDSENAQVAALNRIRFFLVWQDPNFLLYTDLPAYDPGKKILQFTNSNANEESPDLVRMHNAFYAGESDIVDRPDTIQELVPSGMIGIIDITLNPATENSHTPPDLINYEIRFKNRAYYWRYLIINRQDHDLSSPKITSTNPDIAFSDPETIDIPNIPGPVIEIKSTSPIAICENYAFSNELESSLDKFPLPSPDDKNLQVNKDGSYSAYMYVYV